MELNQLSNCDGVYQLLSLKCPKKTYLQVIGCGLGIAISRNTIFELDVTVGARICFNVIQNKTI